MRQPLWPCREERVPVLKLTTLFPNYCDNTWVSHIVFSLVREFASDPDVDVELIVDSRSADLADSAFLTQAIPRALQPLVYRLDRSHALRSWFRRRALRRSVQVGGAAFIWPGGRESLEDAGAAPVPIVQELINCHTRTARRILEAEAKRIGVPIGHGITDEGIAYESSVLDRASLVFAPSPLVRDSLLENGVPEDRIFLTSYGWCPRRIENGGVVPGRTGDDGPLRLVLVGRLSLRKGVHVLVDAWRRAALDGAELILCGSLTEEVREVCGDSLADPSIRCLGHVTDVAAILREANAFVLPSFEEGSPLATYEAMAMGLPCLVSPMGGGGVVRDGVEGLVREPTDADGWVDALRTLHGQAGLRQRLGQAAFENAQGYTWQAVAGRRLARIKDLVAGGVTAVAT